MSTLCLGKSISGGGQYKCKCKWSTGEQEVLDGPTQFCDTFLQRQHCARGFQESQGKDGRRQGGAWTPSLQIGERRVNFLTTFTRPNICEMHVSQYIYMSWKNSAGQICESSSEQRGSSTLVPFNTAAETNLVEAPRISRISADKDFLRKASAACKLSADRDFLRKTLELLGQSCTCRESPEWSYVKMGREDWVHTWWKRNFQFYIRLNSWILATIQHMGGLSCIATCKASF